MREPRNIRTVEDLELRIHQLVRHQLWVRESRESLLDGLSEQPSIVVREKEILAVDDSVHAEHSLEYHSIRIQAGDFFEEAVQRPFVEICRDPVLEKSVYPWFCEQCGVALNSFQERLHELLASTYDP